MVSHSQAVDDFGGVQSHTTVAGHKEWRHTTLAQYHDLLREDESARYPGWEERTARKKETLTRIEKGFALTAREPFVEVKALQAAFDPSSIRWSDEYYDVLGMEREEE